MAEMAVLFLSGSGPRSPEPYLPFASAERQAVVRRLKAPADRSRSLWAELFARWRLAELAGVRPGDVALAHDGKGAPVCRGADFALSLSHSGPYIAVAVGRQAAGVDVERRRKASDAVAQRWFRPEEAALLRALPEDARARAFFRLWTIKEAALKYSREGLSGGLETVDCLALCEAARDGAADALAATSFALPEGAVASVVAERRALPEKARFFTLRTGEGGIYGDAGFIEGTPLPPLTEDLR